MERHLWITGLLPEHHHLITDVARELHNVGYEVHVQHVTNPEAEGNPTAEDPAVPEGQP